VERRAHRPRSGRSNAREGGAARCGAVVLAVGFRPRQHDAFAPVGLESRSHLRGVLPRYPRPAFAISGARAKRSASTAWRC